MSDTDILTNKEEVLTNTKELVQFCIKTRKSVFVNLYYFFICLVPVTIVGLICLATGYDYVFMISVALPLFILLALYGFLRWLTESYQFTAMDVVHKSGVLFVKKKVLALKQVELINLKQGPIGRLLNYGTLVLKAPILHKTTLTLTFVPDPEVYTKIIERIAHQASDIESIIDPN